MKKIIIGLMLTILMFSGISMATPSFQFQVAFDAAGANGPAPNSGDGIPDGSGNDAPYGPVKGN